TNSGGYLVERSVISRRCHGQHGTDEKPVYIHETWTNEARHTDPAAIDKQRTYEIAIEDEAASQDGKEFETKEQKSKSRSHTRGHQQKYNSRKPNSQRYAQHREQ